MKILAVGDPHGYNNIKDIKVNSSIDLILITGDLADASFIRKYALRGVEQGLEDWRDALSKEELIMMINKSMDSAFEVLKYFNQFGVPVFFVLGNIFSMNYSFLKRTIVKFELDVENFEDKIKELENVKNIGLKRIELNGISILGIPYFDNKDWLDTFECSTKYKHNLAKEQEPVVQEFLDNTSSVDIILSHIPPFGILDKVNAEFAPKNWQGKNAGSKSILEYLKNNKFKFCICGHIHESYGRAELNSGIIYNLGLARTVIINI